MDAINAIAHCIDDSQFQTAMHHHFSDEKCHIFFQDMSTSPYIRSHTFTTHILDQPSYDIMETLFDILPRKSDIQQYLSKGWKSAVGLLNSFLQGEQNTNIFMQDTYSFLVLKTQDAFTFNYWMFWNIKSFLQLKVCALWVIINRY